MATNGYPERPPFFSMKFGRLMAKVCLANELGSDVYCLLRVIADTEDAKGYRDAVTFFNEQLAPMVGCRSVDTLARVRARAVAGGWLAYTPGGKGRPGRYWVVVPDRLVGLADAPSDERPGDYLRTGAEESTPPAPDTSAPVRKEPRENGPADPVSLRTGAEENGLPPHGCGKNRGQPAEHSSYSYSKEEGAHPPNTSTPTPTRKPTTPKADPAAVPIPAGLDAPEFRSVWGDWLADRRARRKPLTERAARFQLADLAGLAPAGAVACIRASIANGWTGLFPDRFRDPASPAGLTAEAARPAPAAAPGMFDHKRYAPMAPAGGVA